jgi:Mrp family chromosome partitioning ATPase
MSARARNAARRGILIASVGSVAVITTLFALVLLPRGVDRALRAELERIPAPRDTAPLVALLDRARARRDDAQRMVRPSRIVALASPVSPVASDAADVAAVVDSGALLRDSASIELQQRLARVRADSRLLQTDGRVRALVDSIAQVEREREAYAALGGPDARYATLTTRLTTLGQRIQRIAESQLAERRDEILGRRDALASTDSASAIPDSAAIGSTPLLATRVAEVDSVAVRAALALTDTVTLLERTVAETRTVNTANAARRENVRRRTVASVPPIAMLLSALVVGLAIGYATAVLRELRRPTVGDESEVERLTQTRVIVHGGSRDVTRDVRTRRRADRTLSPALDPTAEAWQQLHLTLTGLGDVARSAQVMADDALLGTTLTINLSAAAARESRATLVVEAPTRTPLLATLLRAPRARGIVDVQQGRVELREVIMEVAMGRDVNVDVLFAGTPPRHASRTALTPTSTHDVDAEMRRISARYDLTLVVGDTTVGTGVTAQDVILCARLGVTSLEWLSRVAAQVRGNGQRLRAVLLWAAETPEM